MTLAQYEAYILSKDDMEHRALDDNLYPKVRSNRRKAVCYVIAELTKECKRCFKIQEVILMSKKTKPKSKIPIPEDYELSDSDEPK